MWHSRGISSVKQSGSKTHAYVYVHGSWEEIVHTLSNGLWIAGTPDDH